jgi:hypothetical protein
VNEGESIVKKFALASALAFLTAGSAWAAPLLGNTVKFEYHLGSVTGSPYPESDNGLYTVGDGVEIARIADLAGTMDISADRIVIHFPFNGTFGDADTAGPLSFNGWVLSDASGLLDAFTAVSIDMAATTLAHLDAVNLSFNADAITVDWKGLVFGADEQLVLRVGTGAIPEPGTLSLMIAALLGIALVRRSA